LNENRKLKTEKGKGKKYTPSVIQT